MAQIGIPDCSQHEQGDRRRSGQPMNDAHDQWSQPMIEGQATQPAVHVGERRLVVTVAVIIGAVPVGMLMDVVAMRVGVLVGVRVHAVIVRVHGHPGACTSSFLDDPAHAGERQQAEQDKHDADGEFHGQAHACGNHDAEQDDRAAHHQNGERVSDALDAADQRRAAQRALPADDGGDRDDMVGIGGVPHTEEEPEEEQ